jgi:hypothetical protein
MTIIRIPREHWGRVWGALVAAGPVSRISEEPIYVVSEEQVQMLRRQKLPFEVVPSPNGASPGRPHA